MRISFEYRRNATSKDLLELAYRISPLEVAALPEGLSGDALAAAFRSLAAHCRTYTVRLGGRLCGVCFVEDFDDRRLMAFTKTEFLTTERKLTFARGIAQLLRELADAEAEAGRDAKPMYMHVPEGDAKSEAWFIAAGCRKTDKGLLCPGKGGLENGCEDK